VDELKNIVNELNKSFSNIRRFIRRHVGQFSDVDVSEGLIDGRGSGKAMVIEPYSMLKLKNIIKRKKLNSAGIYGLSFKA